MSALAVLCSVAVGCLWLLQVAGDRNRSLCQAYLKDLTVARFERTVATHALSGPTMQEKLACSRSLLINEDWFAREAALQRAYWNSSRLRHAVTPPPTPCWEPDAGQPHMLVHSLGTHVH